MRLERQEREAYIVSVLAGSGSGGLGDAIREQALGKGFQCDGC